MIKKNSKYGTLYIVGTPIGNMKDITYRAIEVLQNVDIILAEDTRQTLKLLTHYGIKKPLISYHRHNEQDKILQVVSLLEEGKEIALVSDAGMPIISDPGSALMQHLCKNDYSVQVVPGVTAVITGLVKSAMDCSRFVFEGFLSVNKKQRKSKLEGLKNETRTIVFYEAPHKILYTLRDILETIGDREICIARELTKIHEEYRYTTATKAIDDIEKNGIKGEIVLIIKGKEEKELQKEREDSFSDIDVRSLVISIMKEDNISKKEAIKKAAKIKGVNKNEIYKEVFDI